MTKFLADAAETRLDRFELIAELASGGMATVYLARLGGVGGFQRFVAIKRLHPHLAKEHEFTQMFLDEARLAARLHHPNVVPILEIGMTDQGYYLVMEYIEGDTLARLLARSAQAGRPLAMSAGVRICLDALAGLHAAHELTDDDGKPLEIVHRDVSPQNVLLGVDGISRITDFGVARAASRLTTTRSGQLKGKLAYMAPEQARGKDIDRRADVFAMGIVLWETLAQKRLFKGEGEAETLNRVLFEPIPSPRTLRPEIPASLEAIVMKALERDPAARFASCAEMGDALEAAARAEGMLGDHKEVAAHLASVIGTDISQQRDAVRAWLARSEPSRQQLAIPVPSSGSKLPDPSSVSSAILAVPGMASTPPPISAPARKSRAWVWAVVALVAIGVAVPAVLFTMRGSKAVATDAPRDMPPNTSAPSVTPSAASAGTATAAGVAATPSAALAAPSSPASTTPTVKLAGTRRPPGTGAAHTAATPPATTTTSTATAPPTSTKPTLQDENPYR